MALRAPAFNDARTYGAEWLRYNTEVDNQEGVLSPGDLKVTAAAGGGMRVDVAAGAALVKGDSGVPGTGLSQGLFIVVNDASIPNAVTLAAAHATLPRLDQIVLRVRDSSDLGSGADDAIIDFVTGVATSGATLDNRTGAAALPADCLRLADVLVPAASAAVTAGNVRDRRPWARGALSEIVWTSGSPSVTSTTFAVLPTIGTGLQQRIECSGVPLVIELQGRFISPATAGAYLSLMPTIDGAIPAVLGTDDTAAVSPSTVIVGVTMPKRWRLTPAAGSHLVSLFGKTSGGGSGIVVGTAAEPLRYTIQEDVKQPANNGTT